jgi:hypothetical protein
MDSSAERGGPRGGQRWARGAALSREEMGLQLGLFLSFSFSSFSFFISYMFVHFRSYPNNFNAIANKKLCFVMKCITQVFV